MSFENRWMIVGELTTTTPLHIGNGAVTENMQLVNSQTGEAVRISAICTDNNGRPYIPGSTLKGNLRAWAKQAGLNLANFEQLFGSEDPENTNSVGGKVEFQDACAGNAPHFSEETQPPYWRTDRLTGVIAGVAIDRRTRTASEDRLFHHEFVPRGVSFAVTITGQNYSDAELEDLLFVLTGFNHEQVTLGARVGDGWGRLSWELTDLRRLTTNEIESWLRARAPMVGYEALISLSDTELGIWRSRIDQRAKPIEPVPRLMLNITLNFDSHFLVNDPSQTGTVDEGKPAHAPLRDTKGRLLLPAASLRGALRAQAERILRTLHGEKAACYPDNRGSRRTCGGVYDVSDIERLCPVCRMFGAPGWQSPLRISDFTTATPTRNDQMQDFLAIDRFTGGGAEGAKFNARAAYRPVLSGTIALDLNALVRAGAGSWALGLLALTLRDLAEGDIRLGFGAAKGYGSVRANIALTSLPAWSDCPSVLKANLSEDQWQRAGLGTLEENELRAVMETGVKELANLVVPAAA